MVGNTREQECPPRDETKERNHVHNEATKSKKWRKSSTCNKATMAPSSRANVAAGEPWSISLYSTSRSCGNEFGADVDAAALSLSFCWSSCADATEASGACSGEDALQTFFNDLWKQPSSACINVDTYIYIHTYIHIRIYIYMNMQQNKAQFKHHIATRNLDDTASGECNCRDNALECTDHGDLLRFFMSKWNNSPIMIVEMSSCYIIITPKPNQQINPSMSNLYITWCPQLKPFAIWYVR